MLDLFALSDDLAWTDDAACKDMPLTAFFVAAGRVISDEAREVCTNCPVRVPCLKLAYDRDLKAGYFGGLSHGQREKISFEEALELIATQSPGHATEASGPSSSEGPGDQDGLLFPLS